MLSRPRQDNPQMLYMVCLIFRVNQDIIDKHNHELVSLKGMTKYSYKPYLVEKAILGTSSGLILIW